MYYVIQWSKSTVAFISFSFSTTSSTDESLHFCKEKTSRNEKRKDSLHIFFPLVSLLVFPFFLKRAGPGQGWRLCLQVTVPTPLHQTDRGGDVCALKFGFLQGLVEMAHIFCCSSVATQKHRRGKDGVVRLAHACWNPGPALGQYPKQINPKVTSFKKRPEIAESIKRVPRRHDCCRG